MAKVELDLLDRRVLEELQDNNQISADLLGERVGLSASAVQRRIKRLRQARVIIGDNSIVDPKAVGRGSLFVVEVTLERESTAAVEEFKRKMRASPEVQQCYWVTGEADFILMITAIDIEDYERIAQKLFFDAKNIRKFKTGVVLTTVKATLGVPCMSEASTQSDLQTQDDAPRAAPQAG
jgi:Lrp/AsnC family leucine-responsive transcriptional regulator